MNVNQNDIYETLKNLMPFDQKQIILGNGNRINIRQFKLGKQLISISNGQIK